MAEELIVKICGGRDGQRRANIPKSNTDIKKGDRVKIIKIEDSEKPKEESDEETKQKEDDEE